jgi:Asp-tRNA(Asn)/Glu-tRNA(Gln) amidotransferase A subunit family amidase
MPATEYFQTQRVRRRFMNIAHEICGPVDAVVAPQAHGAMHALTNMTGQPAITMRSGFRDDGTPRAVTLWGQLFDDGRLLQIGDALERKLDLWSLRPPDLG